MLAGDASTVPRILAAEAAHPVAPPEPSRLLAHLLRRRDTFGITRVGSVTRLDRIGLPVVQVVRPLSLVNAVCQGKGLTPEAAAIGGLMEALETWAAERIDPQRVRTASARSLGRETEALFAPLADPRAEPGWADRPIPWLGAWDLLAGTISPVPLALVDTCYTHPSPHPVLFPRSTTGLGAGTSLTSALVQAAGEVLERAGIAACGGGGAFRDSWRVPLRPAALWPRSRPVLDRLAAAGFVVAAWRLPAEHALPIVACHVMEGPDLPEWAPLPAFGAACHADFDTALLKSLLEAVQGRMTAVAGAREDVTRAVYPPHPDRAALRDWREHLVASEPPEGHGPADEPPDPPAHDCPVLLGALRRAGARAVMAVPLLADPVDGLCVVRVVAPPLAVGLDL